MTKQRRSRRVLLWSGGAALAVVLGAVALGPTIASAMAPGLIERSVNPGIKGRVKVGKAAIGWFKGLEAGPIEVYDAAGELAARVQASAPVTVWKALTGRYWSARRLDLGTIDVRGRLDLKQYLDGTTNLDRALAAKDGAARPAPSTPSAGSESPGKPPPSLKATLRIPEFDITVRNEKDSFKNEIALKGLKGEARIDANLDDAAAGGGVIIAAADFSGSAAASGEAGASAMALKLDADVRRAGGAKGWTADGIENAKVKLSLKNAPIAVADAVASMGGALVQGVGDSADVEVDVEGNSRQLGANVKMTSAGLNAASSVSIKDGVLSTSADRAAAVTLRSTEFLENLPQTRAGVAKAGEKVRLTGAPSVEIALESLRVPLPQGGTEPSKLDMRGASVVLRVKVSGMAGQVLLPDAGGAGNMAGAWKPFAVEPIELVVDIPDLSKPVNISTGTRATLDGRPAGDIRISIDADGLLTDKGLLRALQGGSAGFANKADARVRIAGVSTALVQPVVAGALKDLPLELGQDVGPTLDIDLLAKADVAAVKDAGSLGSGIGSLPPVNVSADIASSNIKARIGAKLDSGVLTTGTEGINLTVEAAAPLAQRIVAASRAAALKDPAYDPAKPPPTITLAGAGKVELSARDLSIQLKDTRPETLLSTGRGTIAVALSDLNAAVDMGGNKSPVRIERNAVTLTLAPGAGPKVAVDGNLSHDNQPFTIKGEYALAGLKAGVPKANGPAMLPALNPMGKLEVMGLPRSVLGVVPALGGYASPGGVPADADELSRQIAALVRESIGSSLNLVLALMPAAAERGGGQLVNLNIATQADGAKADMWARIAASEVELSLVSIAAALVPARVNPVLAAATAPKPGDAAQSSAPGGPMRLGGPTKLYITMDKPVTVPLAVDATGAATPNWAKAGVLNARAAFDADLAVENIAMGGGKADASGRVEPVRTGSLALRQLGGEVSLPLAGIPAGQRGKNRATVAMKTTALNRASGDAQIAKLAVDATALMDGKSPEATVRLTEISSAALENLLGQQDLIVGAIGESAEATLRVKPESGMAGTVGEVLGIEAEMTSPRVQGMKLALAKDDAHVWLTKPSTITWQPNEAFINRYLLGGAEAAPAEEPAKPGTPAQEGRRRRRNQPAGDAPGAPPEAPSAGLTLSRAQPITVNIERLSAAMSASDAAGNPTAGPLKPGVFDLSLSARAPSMSMSVAASKAGQPPSTLTIEGLTISASSAKVAAGAAAPGPLELNLGVDKVSGSGTGSGRKSTARVTLTNLADGRGVVTAERAVVNADVDVEAFPTPIVDNLANQNGLLTELLGPTVTLVAKARNVSKGGGGAGATGGDLNVEATSQRATAKVKGDVRGGQFVQTGPLSVELREIRNELVKALGGSLAIIDSLEKVPPDEPAAIVTEGLTIPLDQDMRKLGGKVSVSMGVARFKTSGFTRFIRGLGGKDSGTIGRKIQPFVVNIDKGVATYDRFRLPVGEFAIETTGKVDLVQRQIDLITYAPLGALTDEALGLFKTGLPAQLGVFNEATKFPFRTRGSLDDPKTVPDVELFAKDLVGNVLKEPGKILEGIGDLIKPKK